LSEVQKIFFFFIGYFIIGRLYELFLTKKSQKVWVDELGSSEVGLRSRNLMIIFHSSWFIALIYESIHNASFQPVPIIIGCIILLIIAQLLRFHSMKMLGPLWSTRIYLNEQPPLTREGLYRWIRHPNYFAVILEFVALPLMFGLWRVMIIYSLLNLVMLYFRTKLEDEVLGQNQAPWRILPGVF
tara:strand:- start:895 stop:1449 length:555 start_codon:yes stop_codon:yes gene_type:complete